MFMFPMPLGLLGAALVFGWLAPGDGLAAGIGMFISIFCSGDACGLGEGELAGICIPGMFSICCGDACGDAPGEGEDVGIGMLMPGMFCMLAFPVDGEGVGVRD